MWVLGLVTPHGAVGWTSPLLLVRRGSLETLLPPEAVYPFVVHRPALSPQYAVCHPPTPANVLGCDLPEAMPEFGLLNVGNFAGMSLRAAVLAHHLAGESL
jgi:hypothetical protein